MMQHKKKSVVINGIEMFHHEPTEIFHNHKAIFQALCESIRDWDMRAFVDIFTAYVRVHFKSWR